MRAWDDYFWPGSTVLINKRGLTDQGQLDQFEYFRAAVREHEIRSGAVNIDRTFDATHVKALHGYLFQDLYDWAGQYREVDMFKGRLPFAAKERIDSYLADTKHLIDSTPWPDLDRDLFAEQSAKVYAHVNTAHPFREGNGRVGKLLMSQLAERTRYDFNFGAIDKAAWDQASEFSRPDIGQYTPHHHFLTPVFAHITVDRPPTQAAPTAVSESALRAARLASRDHPTNPRRAGSTPAAGQAPQSTSYRPPPHYRRDPGRDSRTGRD